MAQADERRIRKYTVLILTGNKNDEWVEKALAQRINNEFSSFEIFREDGTKVEFDPLAHDG